MRSKLGSAAKPGPARTPLEEAQDQCKLWRGRQERAMQGSAEWHAACDQVDAWLDHWTELAEIRK